METLSSPISSPSMTEGEADPFSQFIIFGDSLTDPGNVFNVTRAANAIIPGIVEESPPVPPYDSQGRITNGDPQGLDPRSIWVDFLATKLNLDVKQSTQLAIYDPLVHPTPPFVPPIDPLAPAPVLLRLDATGPDLELNTFFNGATATENINFAYGGATSGELNVSDPGVPGVLKQIESYLDDLSRTGSPAQPDTLFSIWGGTNDFDPIARGIPVNPSLPVDNAEMAIESLYEVGGRTFLIHTTPDLGIRPLLDPLPDAVKEEYTTVSDEYNEQLTERLSNLSETLADITIIPVQVNDLLTFVRANPGFFGFTNTEDSFLAQPPGSANPDEFVIWDGEHPTRAAHEILGNFTHQTTVASLSTHPLISGTPDLDILIGGPDKNRILGRRGNDLILGGFGKDFLLGQSGNDLINGESGNDLILGGRGEDRLNGSVGNDKILGGAGADLVLGGFGNDCLLGGDGADSLEGGRGRDKMRGGKGEDTFIFDRDLIDGIAERDIIYDFNEGDRLDLSGYETAGGTITTKLVRNAFVRVTLTDQLGSQDVVAVFGANSALQSLL